MTGTADLVRSSDRLFHATACASPQLIRRRRDNGNTVCPVDHGGIGRIDASLARSQDVRGRRH